MDDSPPLKTPLAQLEGADLIRRIKELELAYQFKHNLIQESAYASLLRNDRRALHRACAQAIESGYPNLLDENAALLAQHYAEAGDAAKTFVYALRAGNAAMRVHALTEALMQYDIAAALTEQLPLTTGELVEVYQKRGRTLEVMGRYPEAVAAYRALEALGKARGDPALEIGALLPLATLYNFPNPAQNLDEAARVNKVVLALTREIHDQAAEARVLWNMQQHAYFSGHPNEAVAYSQQALALADRLGLDELRAYILNDVSRAMTTVESVPAALQVLAEARELWRKSGNLPMLADNLSSTADAAQWGGKIQLAEDYAREALTLSHTIGNFWNLAYSSGTLMQVYMGRGETERALQMGVETVQRSKQSGFLMAGQIAEIMRATIYSELGEADRGLDVLNALPSNTEFLFFEVWRLGTLALLELRRHNLPAVRAAIEKALAYGATTDLSSYGPIYMGLCNGGLALQEHRYADAINEIRPVAASMRKVQVHFFLPDLLLLEGTAHVALNETDMAESVLAEGEALAREMEARPRLWQILAARADLETRRGNSAHSAALRQEASAVIQQLAAFAPAEFRATFLGQPHVRTVLDA